MDSIPIYWENCQSIGKIAAQFSIDSIPMIRRLPQRTGLRFAACEAVPPISESIHGYAAACSTNDAPMQRAALNALRAPLLASRPSDLIIPTCARGIGEREGRRGALGPGGRVGGVERVLAEAPSSLLPWRESLLEAWRLPRSFQSLLRLSSGLWKRESLGQDRQ
jgi:hypothetical protein